MKWPRRLLALVLIVLVPYLWIVNCTGPRPTASDLRVQAPAGAGAPYHVTVLVTNTGPGHGEVQVTFILQDNATDHIYQNTDTVTLESGQAAVVGVDINAPPGSYTPSVQIGYPPG